jgi:uncharacterized protein (UPF0303 family)
MATEDDIARMTLQEETLRFPSFDVSDAWKLGSLLREMALERKLAVVIDVKLHSMSAFYAALPGTSFDNENWVRRKRNVALHFSRPSYAIGLRLAEQKATIEEKFGLAHADYAPHGGSFPIVVEGSGCIGAVTVSGLPQREDHKLVVEALAVMLGKDVSGLQLAGLQLD